MTYLMNTSFAKPRFYGDGGHSGGPSTSVQTPTEQADVSEKDNAKMETAEGKATKSASKQHQAFEQFTRRTTPTPPPSKREFYWSELKANYLRSKMEGNQRYREQIRHNKLARLKLMTLSVLAGLGFTAFRRLRRTFSYLFMLGLLIKPIRVASQTFPRMEQAYEQVKQGDPSKGKETCSKAISETMYSFIQDFMKPLSYGMSLALLLTIPLALRNNGDGAFYRIFKEVARQLRIKPNKNAWGDLGTYTEKLTKWGDTQANRLRQWTRFFHWFETS